MMNLKTTLLQILNKFTNRDIIIPAKSFHIPEQYIQYATEFKINTYIANVNNKKYQIKFKVYRGVNDYLKSRSRIMVHHEGLPKPTIKDFVMRDLNNLTQKSFLDPFIQAIRSITLDKGMQARIAISLVQNIPFDANSVANDNITDKYPYEVLYTNNGICSEKSELLAYILRELGYGVVMFDFDTHIAVGIKCPMEYSYVNSGYAFIETTIPTTITDSSGTYTGSSLSEPSGIIYISDGYSFDDLDVDWKSVHDNVS